MSPDASDLPAADPARRAHLAILAILQLIMAGQLVLLLVREDWLQAFLVVGIMALTLAPLVFRLPVEIPSEIQIVAVLFVFATLFLGEVRDYYQRFWWWDASLHTTSLSTRWVPQPSALPAGGILLARGRPMSTIGRDGSSSEIRSCLATSCWASEP